MALIIHAVRVDEYHEVSPDLLHLQIKNQLNECFGAVWTQQTHLNKYVALFFDMDDKKTILPLVKIVQKKTLRFRF